MAKIIETVREKLVAAFIAETGLKPSECELVESRSYVGECIEAVVSIRKKQGTNPKIEIFINESGYYVIRQANRDDILFEKKEMIKGHILYFLNELDKQGAQNV